MMLYYAPYIKLAAEKGIVNGIGNNEYAPNASISRQDLAVILANYVDKMEIHLKQTMQIVAFVNFEDIANYAVDEVGTMVRTALVSGKLGKIFDSKGSATHEEVAAMLHRFV